ncbi:MAG: hypothetical protein NTX64_10190 [Elusimicrobia bacterium]|nr:hypothetical protein [Elusimicrobiota bacterium]
MILTRRNKDDDERKGGGVSLWLGGGHNVERLFHWFLTAPDAWLARAGLGAALALNLAWLAASVANPGSPPARATTGAAFARKPLIDAPGTLLSPRAMITGFKYLLAPDFAASQPAPSKDGAQAGAGGSSSPLLELNGAAALKEKEGKEGGGKGKEGGEAEGGKDKDKGKDKDTEGSAAAGAGVHGGAGGGTGGAAGRSVFGMARGPSSLAAGMGAGSGRGPAADLNSAETTRAKTPMTPGGRTYARVPSRSRSAMDQLRFAQGMSQSARQGATSEHAYQAADSAFQGQAAAPGGIPATAGTPSQGPSQPALQQPAESGPHDVGLRPMSCPAGYALHGSQCQWIQDTNVTPYQNLVNMARTMLIIAAILAAIGLFLLLRKSSPGTGGSGVPGASAAEGAGGSASGAAGAAAGTPMGQILGGMLLGAAVALAIAALAIGNAIQQDYQQAAQNKAIQQGAGNALQGKIGN